MTQTLSTTDSLRTETSSLRLCGLDCADCAVKLEKKISRMPGVKSASVNFGAVKLTVEHSLPLDKVISAVTESGYGAEVEGAVAKTASNLSSFRLGGVDCADCAAKLEKKLRGLSGVEEVSLNFGAAVLTVRHTCPAGDIVGLVRGSGYGIEPIGSSGPTPVPAPFYKDKKMVLTALSGTFLGVGFLLSLLGMPETVKVTTYLLAILAGGFYTARSGLYALRSFSLDMNFLMTVAVIGAAAIGEWSEGATVVFLFSLGNALQSYTMDKTRNSIRTLMDLSPKEALVRRNGTEISLPSGEIAPGDILLVRPGERIAMDGDVLSGSSGVDQSPITGESIPLEKNKGDRVYAGTINGRGFMEILVTRAAKDNTLSRIIKLVEEAQAQRAPSQQFVDVFAKYYTPLVIAGAVLTAALPPLAFGQPFAPWFERALILLVISCPCALVISTPVSIVSAIGSAAKRGVLIKGGAHLEEAGALKVVAFDKTGTLTTGRPEVTDILPAPGHTQEELLKIAASIESCSEHSLATAVLRLAKDKKLHLPECSGFRSFPGKGAAAEMNGTTYYAGNRRLFAEAGIPADAMPESLSKLEQKGKTPVIVGSGKEIIGVLAVADRVRNNAGEAVEDLRRAGIERVVMLTGDNPGAAAAVAAQLGVDDFKAGLLPEDKLDVVRSLKKEHGKLAMVGDGVNDTPALAAATVGIAMGAAGTDTALETADIALMADDLTKLPYVIRLGRRTLKTIKQNIGFSVLIKGAFIAATFAGMANLWMAVFADTGAALLVILNGMRLLKAREESRNSKEPAPVACAAVYCSKA